MTKKCSTYQKLYRNARKIMLLAVDSGILIDRVVELNDRSYCPDSFFVTADMLRETFDHIPLFSLRKTCVCHKRNTLRES